MTTLIDTSVIIDVLRGRNEALTLLVALRTSGHIHASEVTRAEVLGGMRPGEEQSTQQMLRVFVWHPVDEQVAEQAGELARTWRRSHSGIDVADYLIAATAIVTGSSLCTRNIKRFPMFTNLTAPYQ